MSRPGQGKSTTLVAVDTGGTFTDLVVLDEGGIRTLKVPSTPSDAAEAVLEGLRRIVPRGSPFDLVHGSTVATNALLERRGARLALITNRGFEDVIEIARQNRPRLYALEGRRPPPLVDRNMRIGIRGRIAADGSELEPLHAGELDELAARVQETAPDADALAVCLLHSYVRPDHEEAVAEALAPLGRPVSLSSAILAEYREYERTSTTVANAYVAPVVSRYLGRMEQESGAASIRIMGSGGGSLPLGRAVSQPVRMVLSGPAGGVTGALWWASRVGYDHVLTFDMGGTSTDVSLAPGRPLRTRELTVAGLPIATPVLDIHTVGAGGGSIARVDPGGALRVGPESAGADPGPVAYGKGGTKVTVTDVHVWLGRIPPRTFLGGEQVLDREAVGTALRRLATEVGGSREEVSEGVLAVADSAMERALRVISVERGHDPEALSLVSFGGAGGLHAARLAHRLGIPRVLVPPHPGLLSAVGMITAAEVREGSRTVLRVAPPGGGPDGGAPVREELDEVFDALEDEIRNALATHGRPMERAELERTVDARYRGQSFELGVPAARWVEAFHDAHEERYGYRREENAVEAVTLRVRAILPPAPWSPPRLAPAAGPPDLGSTETYMEGEWRQVGTVTRDALRAGHQFYGPVVVTEYSGTTWVPPGWAGEMHPEGVLELRPSPP